jgi:peptide/nickel transport system ATP-binding protein
MTAYSIMGLIDAPGKVVGGEIIFKGQDLRRLSASAMRQIRGNRIAMIFQDPMATLNPVLRIDTQMMETIFAHQKVSATRAREMARDALGRVGIAAPDERLSAYPHQFSGGMRQRVAIAIALLNKPDLIICDEPTTALDVTIQGQILFEMQKLCKESGTALIWITHDLSVVAGLADSVAVMYAGQVVESGSVQQILEQPRHPYTSALIAAAPSRNPRGSLLQQIPGATPSLLQLPAGCGFRQRCQFASATCTQSPELTVIGQGEQQRSLRCFHPIPSTSATLHEH